MTPEQVKQQLGQYRKIRDECERLRRRMEEKKKDMMHLQAVVADGMTRSSNVSDSVERAIEQIDALIGYYAQRVVLRESAEREVLKMIESVDEPDGRSILFLRYVEGKRFEEIELELHISEKTRKRRYNKAIEKLTLFDPL